MTAADQQRGIDAADFYVEFGRRLADARIAAGISQPRLAALFGLTRSAVSNVETGRRSAAAHTVVRYAAVLGVNPLWLLTGRGPRTTADTAGAVIHLHVPTVRGPRGDRELDVLLIRKETQLSALLDHVTAEALFVWCGRQTTPPTDTQIETQRRTFRAHYVAVVRASTRTERGPR